MTKPVTSIPSFVMGWWCSWVHSHRGTLGHLPKELRSCDTLVGEYTSHCDDGWMSTQPRELPDYVLAEALSDTQWRSKERE